MERGRAMRTHLILGTLLGAALALVGPLAGEGRGDFELHGDEQMTVDTSYYEGGLYDQSRARIVSGGSVTFSLCAYHFSAVDISGNGYVKAHHAYNSSTLTISGGSVDGLVATDTSAVDISGGSVNYTLHAYNCSTVDISGGSVGDLLASDSSAVDISGGSVAVLRANSSSAVDISGGSVVDLYAYDTSTVTFHARDFSVASGLSLDGDRVQGTGILSGEWFDGKRWAINIRTNDATATILAIPEPATLGLLAVGGVLALRRRR